MEHITTWTPAALPAPARLVQAARGFTALFWGIPLGLLLLTGALHVRMLLRFDLPLYLLGSVVSAYGLLHLRPVLPDRPPWRRRVRGSLEAVALQLGLAPFAYWWIRAPFETYFVANGVLFLAATLWLLVNANRLASLLAGALGEATFALEARYCAWGTVLLVVLPIAYATVAAVEGVLQGDTSLWMEISQVPFHMPRWLLAMTLLPFSLTMACCWKAKELCLRRVAAGGQTA